jgi:hypothetical protein
VVIRSHTLKEDKKHNEQKGEKNKKTNNGKHNTTQKTKDLI